MESYRITVPLDPVEDKEIIERMPKWARGNWIREQVKKAITMQGSTESSDLRKFVEEYLQQQGSITQNQVRNWIAEALQHLPSATRDQVQEIVANVLQKQMAITEQQVKHWVQEAVSALQVTEYQEKTIEPDEGKIRQNDVVANVETMDESHLVQNSLGSIADETEELPVLKSYEVLESEPTKQGNPADKRHVRVVRRPMVKAIETVAPDRSVEEKDEYSEYGKVDFTLLGDIEGFGKE